MFHFKSRIDVLGITQAVNEQAGAHQGNQRERNLYHDQDATQSIPAGAAGGGIGAITQDGQTFCARGLQRGHEAAHQSGKHRDAERIEQHLAIETEIKILRHTTIGQEPGNQRSCPKRANCAQQTSHNGEQKAFGQKLADQPFTGSTHRKPNGNFALTLGSTRQQQIGDVRARNQQHQSYNPTHHNSGFDPCTTLLQRNNCVIDGHQEHTPATIFLGVFTYQFIIQLAHGQLGLAKTHTRLQPSDEKRHTRATLVEPVFQDAGEYLVVHGYGNKDIRTAHGAKIITLKSIDADDVVVLRADADGLAKYLWIAAELGLPQSIADHGDRTSAGGAILLGLKTTTERGLHANNVKKVAIDQQDENIC